MKQQNKKGFTIIEVSLVLAIAGVIFLMVFTALPQMIRTQRDSQRKTDIMTLVEDLQKYALANRGALPTGTLMASGIVDHRPSDTERNTMPAGKETTWDAFYHDYVETTFSDPDGSNYKLYPRTCTGRPTDEQCGGYAAPSMLDYTMHIFIQATCDADHPKPTNNPRDFAIVYRTESSGVYCFNS